MSLTEIAIKRPLLIIVIFTVLFLFGAVSYSSLNYNLLPKIEVPTVSVTTVYGGAAAAEIQTSVTKKLEDAFSSVEGLDMITSTSQEGVSQIVIQFKSGTDVVGILVDDSIVVLENIYRHLEMGSDKRTAAVEGRSEIGFTALAITLVDVVVFLPLAFSGGIIGSLLREFSLVVSHLQF